MLNKLICTMLTVVMVCSACLCSPLYVSAETDSKIDISGSFIRYEGVDSAKFNVSEPGFAGKVFDDITNTITIGSDSSDIPLADSMKNGSGPRYEITHGMNLGEKFTFQYSFYADGDTVAGLCFHWSEVFRWYPDGRIMFNSAAGYNLSGTYIQSAYAKRGQWHTVALTYEPLGEKTDSANAKQYLYLDGKLIASGYRNKQAQKNITGDKTMRVIMFGGSGAGKIAIDDVYAYKGDYDYESDSVTLESADYIKVDNSAGTIYYNEEQIRNVTELKNALLSLGGNYSEMTIFHNNYTELKTYLQSGAICIFKSPSKRAMRYYSLESMYGADDVETICENGVVSASAKVHNHHPDKKYATMVLATYSPERELTGIKKTDPVEVTDNKTLEASLKINNGDTFKVFLLETLQNMKPLIQNRAEPVYEAVCTGGKIWDVDFDTPPSFTIADKGNVIEVTKEADGNNALLHQRVTASDFHTDVKAIATQSDCVVYEYDIKLLNSAETELRVWLKDFAGNYSSVCTLKKNGLMSLGNSTQTLEEDKWYRVSVVYNYLSRSRSFYIGGNLVSDNVPIEHELGDSSYIDLMRFHVEGVGSVSGNESSFLIDNVRVYELSSPQENIESLPRVITIDPGRNILGGYDVQIESDIKDAYSSSGLNSVHPRIQAQKADFKRIIADYKAGSQNVKNLADQILKYADNNILTNPNPVEYVLTDGVRLLNVSRNVLTKMYVLGMAYQLTGNKKYAERAWVDLQAVCDFPDWHPIHSLDSAEMAAAVSIGYDWMYDAFTDEQRKTIEQAMYDNFFYVVCNSFQYQNGFLSAGLLTDMNHNLVLNGAITMSSLAFMDVYPEITAYTLANSLKSAENSISNFAPDGAWVEGPHYWEYSMQYTSKLLSSLDCALATCFGLDETDGLSDAASFILHMQSSNGIFNYGDGAADNQYVPEILWLANKYDCPEAASALIKLSGLSMANAEDGVLALLWLDESSISGDITLPLDSFYEGENVVTFRDEWNGEGGTFVGIHGGKTVVDHSHLDGGSFVFDADGYRWAIDPGSSPYDLEGSFDTTDGRWKYYMNRAEAHNTLVIDPDSSPDHTLDSVVTIPRYETGKENAIAVADTTQLYKGKVTSAKRGFFFTDNRKSLVVRDEIILNQESDVYWFMQTNANGVKLDSDKQGALLSLTDGRQLRIDFVSSHDAQIGVEWSEPLPASPVMENDKYPGCKRIFIKMKSDGNAHITVKLTPVKKGLYTTDVEEYDMSIDNWTIN